METNTRHDTPLLTALEQLAPHDHLCSIYESPEEHFAVAIPFIRIGLDRGEKCIYIADDGTEPAVRDAMYAGGHRRRTGHRDRQPGAEEQGGRLSEARILRPGMDVHVLGGCDG